MLGPRSAISVVLGEIKVQAPAETRLLFSRFYKQ